MEIQVFNWAWAQNYVGSCRFGPDFLGLIKDTLYVITKTYDPRWEKGILLDHNS